MARRVRRRTTLPDGPGRVVRRLLRQRRNRLPPRARLASARARVGPVHRVPQPHQRHSHDSGAGLLGALAHYGLDSIGTIEKDEMRDLVLRGGPWSDAEREAILDYCESDVAALARLLPAMLPNIDLPRALLRGRYMAAAARMERNGVPIDTDTLELLRQHWSDIQDQLIAEIDRDYGVYEGRTFKADRFAEWLAAQ